MIRVHGGFAHRMFRLDTDQGSFAVKELNRDDRRAISPVEDVFRLERAAFAAGIPMPEPISASPGLLVHRWVEGETVPEAPVSPAFGFEIGRDPRAHPRARRRVDAGVADDPPARDWPELAERASATGQPWADELAARVGTLLAIARLVDTCERPGPVVLTHRDIHPWNLLAREGRPVVLDWELSGLLDLSGELGSTALSLAKGPGFDDIDPAAFRSVRRRLRRSGRRAAAAGTELVRALDRRLAGAHQVERPALPRRYGGDAGPDLTLSHEVVRDGLHGLPELYGRLEELQTLLL